MPGVASKVVASNLRVRLIHSYIGPSTTRQYTLLHGLGLAVQGILGPHLVLAHWRSGDGEPILRVSASDAPRDHSDGAGVSDHVWSIEEIVSLLGER